jgi:hypothetical protein
LGNASEQLIRNFSEYLDIKEALLDAYIETGSDHELFIASYIHGHFSVIAANLIHAIQAPENKSAGQAQWQQQTQYMLSQSINSAIANNELVGADAKDVIYMTNMLFVNDNDNDNE